MSVEFLDTSVFVRSNFIDALSVAHTKREDYTPVVSIDRDFNRFTNIQRREP